MRIEALGAILVLAVALVVTGSSAAPPAESALLVKLAAARELPAKTSAKAKAALAATQAKLAAGDAAGAKAAFATWLKAVKPSDAEAHAVAAWLVRDSVLERYPKLAAPADAVRFYAEQVAELKAQLAELRKALKSGEPKVKVRLLVLTPAYAKGKAAFSWKESETELTQNEIKALIAKVEAALAAAEASEAAWQLKLQQAMEDAAEAAAIITKMSKAAHDTAAAIISNIKA